MQILLPKIVALWEELFVPLVHRSRWFLAFRGSEVFYYETEHRRLQHLRTVMGVSSADDGSPESKQSAEKFLEKAQRKLEVSWQAPGRSTSALHNPCNAHERPKSWHCDAPRNLPTIHKCHSCWSSQLQRL